MKNKKTLLDTLKELKEDVHNTLSKVLTTDPLMDPLLERLYDATDAIKKMDNKDPNKKPAEDKAIEIESEIVAKEEKEVLDKLIPEAVYVPRIKKRI